jgi:hypothetical protein
LGLASGGVGRLLDGVGGVAVEILRRRVLPACAATSTCAVEKVPLPIWT